jgi:ribonuclease G
MYEERGNIVEKLIINYTTREKRLAVLNEKHVLKLLIDQPQQQTAVGNIYFGIVTKVLPGMNAVFIDIGEEMNGFIHRDKLISYNVSKEPLEKRKNLAVTKFAFQGEKLLVQVEKDATGTKGPRLVGISEFHPKYNELSQVAEKLKKPSLLYKKDFFFEQIVYELTSGNIGEVFVDDLSLKKSLEKLEFNIPIHFYQGKGNIFATHHIEHEVEHALQRNVPLENGAYLVFDETEALTIIDVNTGKFSGKHNLADTVVQTNLLAAEEIIRQVRLRDIGGMILIDFIDMKTEKDRQQVLRKVENCLRQDEKRTKVIGFTPLGILQLTRKKTKVALSEAMSVSCSVCEGTGRVLSAETIAFRLERELWEHRYSDYEAVWVETTEEVMELFSGEHQAHRMKLEEAIGLKLILTVTHHAKPYYHIRQFGKIEELKAKG